MYKPADRLNPEYPVFKKVNGRIISFLSLKAALLIGACLLISVLLYIGLGKLTYTETVAMDDLELAESQTLYVAQWACLRLPVIDKQLSPYTDENGSMRTDLSAEDRQCYLQLASERSALSMKVSACAGYTSDALASLGEQAGLSSDMLEGEAKACAPVTKQQQTPFLSDMARFAIAFFLVGLTVMLVVEPGGARSLGKCLLDMYKFNTKQHVYLYRRSLGTVGTAESEAGI